MTSGTLPGSAGGGGQRARASVWYSGLTGTRLQFWLVLVLILLASTVRLVGLADQSLWRDEVDSIRFARMPLDDFLRTYTAPGQNGPLYYLILRLWLGLTGDSEFALRSLSALLGVLGVALCYRLARRLFRGAAQPALVASLLCAMSPYLVWYAQEGKMYTLVVVVTLLSTDLFLGALEGGRWHRWLAFGLVAGLAPYVHFVLMLLLPVYAAILLVDGRRRETAGRSSLPVAAAAVLLVCIPLLLWQIPMLLKPGETGYDFAPLHEMVASIVRGFALGVAPGMHNWLLVPSGLLLLAGLVLPEPPGGRIPRTVLALWAAVPIAGLYLVSLSRPLFTARYLISTVPAFALLSGAGYGVLARRSRIVANVLLLAAVAVSGWGVWIQARTPLKADHRSATRYILEHLEPGDLVIFQIPHGRYSFEYYDRQIAAQAASVSTIPVSFPYSVYLPGVFPDHQSRSWYLDGLYTNGGMDLSEVDLRMAEATSGRRVVWLVATEMEMWDERRLVESWLDAHFSLSQEARFLLVTVDRYEAP